MHIYKMDHFRKNTSVDRCTKLQFHLTDEVNDTINYALHEGHRRESFSSMEQAELHNDPISLILVAWYLTLMHSIHVQCKRKYYLPQPCGGPQSYSKHYFTIGCCRSKAHCSWLSASSPTSHGMVAVVGYIDASAALGLSDSIDSKFWNVIGSLVEEQEYLSQGCAVSSMRMSHDGQLRPLHSLIQM